MRSWTGTKFPRLIVFFLFSFHVAGINHGISKNVPQHWPPHTVQVRLVMINPLQQLTWMEDYDPIIFVQ